MAKPIMDKEAIRKVIQNGYVVNAYGKEGYVEEISFTKSTPGGGLAGFSFQSCQLKQRTLHRLFKRVQREYPELVLEG